MKIATLLLCFTAAQSFSVTPLTRSSSLRLFSTLEDETATTSSASSVEDAKQNLILVAKNLQKENGLFMVEKTSKKALEAAVKDLEEAVTLASPEEDEAWKPLGWPACLPVYQGDWTLLASTAFTDRDGIDTSNTPGFLKDPLAKIRSTILDVQNKYLVVKQKIKSTKDDNVIDRIDVSLELEPPKNLRDVLDNLPEQISGLDINPLAVSKSKVVLVHKATVDSDSANTKIQLSSIVLNVAGTSRVLDPNGKDVLGLNIPSLGEFMNSLDFETTFLDEDVRVTRSKVLGFDQLRVFVRSEPELLPKVDIESDFTEEEEIVDIESSLADVDKEGITTPEEDNDDEDISPSDVEGEMSP